MALFDIVIEDKYAKKDSVVFLAKNLDKRMLAICEALETQDAKIDAICRLFDELEKKNDRKIAQIAKTVGDVLPTKYRPAFNSEIKNKMNLIERVYKDACDDISANAKSKISEIEQRYEAFEE